MSSISIFSSMFYLTNYNWLNDIYNNYLKFKSFSFDYYYFLLIEIILLIRWNITTNIYLKIKYVLYIYIDVYEIHNFNWIQKKIIYFIIFFLLQIDINYNS